MPILQVEEVAIPGKYLRGGASVRDTAGDRVAGFEAGADDDLPKSSVLAELAAVALATPSRRTLVVEHAGASYVIKRPANRQRNIGQSLALRWLVKRISGRSLPMSTLRLSQATSGVRFEAQRLVELKAAGVRVPRIAQHDDGFLLLEHCGTTFATLLQSWTASVWRKELPRLAQELAEFHRAGHWHGAAQIKNLTCKDGLHYRIDFEEDFGDFVPLEAAQAFDLVLFLNSISLRGPIDEVEARRLLPELLDAYLVVNPDPLVVQTIAQVLPWGVRPIRIAAQCMRLQIWGRRRNGVARLVILIDVLAQLLQRSAAVGLQQPTPSPD